MTKQELFEKTYLERYADAAESIGMFAKKKHDDTGAKRKFSGEPYFVHPKGVAKILAAFGAGERLLKAAFCHDLLEDADVTWEDLRDESDEDIADIVSELTNDKKDLIRYGNKEDYLNNKLLNLSSDALTIKLGDNYANISDRPSEDQYKRIMNNVRFLKRHRQQLNKIQKQLINAILNQ